MRVKLVDHPEHGLLRLRDDYYARRRAIVGGIVLASALILGQIVALRIDNSIVAYLAQMILSALGFAYGLICAAWPNNPRQTTMGIIGGTAAFCLLALGGGLLMALVILLIAFVPAAAGSLPGAGGALLGVLAVLLGGVAGTFMVVGTAVIICLAGFITLRIAAGADIMIAFLSPRIKSSKLIFLPSPLPITTASSNLSSTIPFVIKFLEVRISSSLAVIYFISTLPDDSGLSSG